jgi:hypothetical protein
MIETQTRLGLFCTNQRLTGEIANHTMKLNNKQWQFLAKPIRINSFTIDRNIILELVILQISLVAKFVIFVYYINLHDFGNSYKANAKTAVFAGLFYVYFTTFGFLFF